MCGAIHAEVDPAGGSGTLLTTQSDFIANQSIWGGAIRILNADATFNQCTFTDNGLATIGDGPGSQDGGAFHVRGDATVVIQGCTATGNRTSGRGGFLLSLYDADVTITDSVITENNAEGGGGGLALENASLRVGSTTLCGNSPKILSFDTGHDQSVVLLADGQVLCWGRDDEMESTVPLIISDKSNAEWVATKQVAAGSYHTAALREDGSVVLWGRHTEGQLNVPGIIGTPGNEVAFLSAGEQHNAALLTDGSMICWGRNTELQCNVPDGVGDSGNRVIQCESGAYHTSAVLENGDIACWGSDTYGQNSDVPIGIGSEGLKVSKVSESYHTVALLEDGSIACWGRNNHKQCDVPDGIGEGGMRVIDVYAGAFCTYAMLEDGSLVGWGSEGYEKRRFPNEINDPGNPVAKFETHAYHSMAVLEDGTLVTWGRDDFSQITNAPSSLTNPTQIFGDYEDLGGNCISEICDTDGDGTIDCDDGCPDDPEKIDPGQCGCGIEDLDTDDDGIADCLDPCPNWPYDCSDDGQTIFVAVGQSIQNALYAIPEGGVIEVAAGTFPIDDLNGLLKTDGDFTLRGSVDVEGIPTTILDAGGDGRLMTLSFGQTNDTIIENLVLQNGGRSNTAGAVGLNNNSSPTFRNCWFRNNTAGRDGGAVHVIESTPRFESCRFQINLANEEGGAVYAITSSIVFTDCFFDGNTSTEGGAMVFEGSTGNLIDASTFIDNIADRGGAIQLGDSDLLVTTSSFDGNISPVSGSAINADVSTLEIADSVICSNGPAEQVSGGYADLGDNCIVEDCGDDLDGNGVPDVCDPDCNGDGIPDAYEISVGTQLDCDLDGIPDGCAVEDGIAPDCNLNGIPDACDILDGVERDDNLNDIPDSCELARGDLNLDGCIDSGDLGLLIALWGITDPPIGDLNGDNIIAAADLGLLIGNWSPCDP